MKVAVTPLVLTSFVPFRAMLTTGSIYCDTPSCAKSSAATTSVHHDAQHRTIMFASSVVHSARLEHATRI